MANIKQKLKVNKPPTRNKKINIERLKVVEVKQHYNNKIEEKWKVIINTPITSMEEEWNTFHDVMAKTSEDVIGFRKEGNGYQKTHGS